MAFYCQSVQSRDSHECKNIGGYHVVQVLEHHCYNSKGRFDNVTDDGRIGMNSDSVHIQPNTTKLTGQHFKLQMDNDPKLKANAI